jgi:hypothetical protein
MRRVVNLGSVAAITPRGGLQPGPYEYLLVLKQQEQVLSMNSYPVRIM